MAGEAELGGLYVDVDWRARRVMLTQTTGGEIPAMVNGVHVTAADRLQVSLSFADVPDAAEPLVDVAGPAAATVVNAAAPAPKPTARELEAPVEAAAYVAALEGLGEGRVRVVAQLGYDRGRAERKHRLRADAVGAVLDSVGLELAPVMRRRAAEALVSLTMGDGWKDPR